MSDWEIRQGDVLEVLATMQSESVQTCVTSPPYYGLRSYNTERWEGGSPECDHAMSRLTNRFRAGDMQSNNSASHPNIWFLCGKCGARRIDRQIGLETTLDEYIARIVEVFREVKRVLRKDGTCWVNLGDSYIAGPTGHQDISASNGKAARMFAKGGRYRLDNLRKDLAKKRGNLKAKDLCMVPARCAIALQEDGWWLRSEIVWVKPAPMPESCTDRLTRSHEMIYLLTKSARYYYDADAIREPLGANKRDVWTVSRGGYSLVENHFATYPPKLIEPCILAGTSGYGACAACGSPWRRVVERANETTWPQRKEGGATNNSLTIGQNSVHAVGISQALPSGGGFNRGWIPTCKCKAGVTPCVVLDPFSGAGTTGLVALRHGRRYVGIELNPEYVGMSKRRIIADAPLLYSLPQYTDMEVEHGG